MAYGAIVRLDLKGVGMGTSETAPGDGRHGALPFDSSKAHQARMYHYLLVGHFL